MKLKTKQGNKIKLLTYILAKLIKEPIRDTDYYKGLEKILDKIDKA